MVNVTIYTAPSCGACTASKRAMTKHGIPFDEVNTAEDAAACAYLRDDLGYTTAPVTAVTYRNGRVHTWTGFDLDQITGTRRALDEDRVDLEHSSRAAVVRALDAPGIAGTA